MLHVIITNMNQCYEQRLRVHKLELQGEADTTQLKITKLNTNHTV